MKTTNGKKRTALNVTLGGLLILIAAGCQSNGSGQMQGTEFPEPGTHAVTQVMYAQEAAGARGDPTLYSYHFDGDRLNSNGERKLSLMLDDDDAVEPLTVYVAPKDDRAAARRDAVALFLRDAGLNNEQIRVEDGIAPGNGGAAAAGLGHLSRTESSGSGEGAGMGQSGSGDSASGGSSY
ncbi:MAG: hypothetical protein ACREIT_02900 [Tepidisphaeraceae bacterium]